MYNQILCCCVSLSCTSMLSFIYIGLVWHIVCWNDHIYTHLFLNEFTHLFCLLDFVYASWFPFLEIKDKRISSANATSEIWTLDFFVLLYLLTPRRPGAPLDDAPRCGLPRRRLSTANGRGHRRWLPPPSLDNLDFLIPIRATPHFTAIFFALYEHYIHFFFSFFLSQVFWSRLLRE